MYEFQDLTPISGHFRTNFKISGISGQRPGLHTKQQSTQLYTHCASQSTLTSDHSNPFELETGTPVTPAPGNVNTDFGFSGHLSFSVRRPYGTGGHGP